MKHGAAAAGDEQNRKQARADEIADPGHAP